MMQAPLDCSAAASEAGLSASRLSSARWRARQRTWGRVLMQHYGRLDSIQQKARAGDRTGADLAAEKPYSNR